MAKKKNQKQKKKPPVAKVNIQELRESRDGGQIALRGYSYQFLYSCNLILSSDTNEVFTLEGVEDIDTIKCSGDNKVITHIQLKYSTQRQDASFMDSVLKNYLEAYLIDKNRYFKLVYDFSVAAGNLRKLFSRNLDNTSREFWKTKIDTIKKETSFWNWSNFDFEDFIQRLSFENVEKNSLEKSIEESLIKNFGINTDNISLFANGLKLFCFDKMETGGEISHQEVTQCIEEIKFDISKGPQNPAHAWIQRLPVTITLGALQDMEFEAELEYISPKGVEENGANQFEIKAAIRVPDSVTVRAGYSANAEIVLQRAKEVLNIPESCVEFSGDTTFVYVLTGSEPQQTFQRQQVSVGMSDGIQIEIKSGLEKGQQVRGNEIN